MVNYLKSFLIFLWEIIKVAVVSLAIILPIRYYLVQPFYVKGASMEPNFLERDYLLIDEISYRFKEPSRGEVIVFHPPVGNKEFAREGSDFYIKRIIGLPGDIVEVSEGKVYLGVNGSGLKILEEDYLPSGRYTDRAVTYTLGMGEYFVLGDNRQVSSDSRGFGPIKKHAIIGRVWVRAWPFTRFSLFKDNPVYSFN